MNNITIYSAEAVSITVPVLVDVNPTGTPPQFALSASDANVPGAFSVGAWLGTYASGKAKAASPTVGGAGTLAILADNTYRLWCKVLVAGETYCEPIATILCP